jgi:hypothetical protein
MNNNFITRNFSYTDIYNDIKNKIDKILVFIFNYGCLITINVFKTNLSHLKQTPPQLI